LCANWFSVRSGLRLISELVGGSRSTEFKKRERHFTRSGPISPDLLVTLLLYLVADGGRRGYAHLLDGFWDEAQEQGVPLPTEKPVSAAAFCKARHKLKPDALRVLLGQSTESFESAHGVDHRFKGRRVFAVDGTKISTQRSPALWQAFGGPTGGHNPQILVSVLHDVVANLPMDATVAPCDGSERDELRLLLKNRQPGDVVVLDRGYPSYDLIDELLERGIDFVIRVPTSNSFHAIGTFVESGGTDYQILLHTQIGSHHRRREPLKVRAVRRDGKDGEAQVFLTSLDRTEFTRGQILQLYQMRWQVELFYRLEKGDYIGQGQFHARTPEGIEQEVLAFLLYVTLCRHLMASAARLHQVPYDLISQKGAILAAGAYLVRLLCALDEHEATRHLTRLLERMARRLEPKRPGRSFPRRSFKPRPRWTATGRHGDQARPS